MERLLILALLCGGCVGDDGYDPSTSTTGPSTTTTGMVTAGESSTTGPVWEENECTKQAIDCFGDEECTGCQLCGEALSKRCNDCVGVGATCLCPSNACVGAYLQDEGNDAVFAACTACVIGCDPGDEEQVISFDACTAILEGGEP